MKRDYKIHRSVLFNPFSIAEYPNDRLLVQNLHTTNLREKKTKKKFVSIGFKQRHQLNDRLNPTSCVFHQTSPNPNLRRGGHRSALAIGNAAISLCPEGTTPAERTRATVAAIMEAGAVAAVAATPNLEAGTEPAAAASIHRRRRPATAAAAAGPSHSPRNPSPSRAFASRP